MRSLHRTAGIVAASIVLLALLTKTERSGAEATRSLSVLSAVEDSGGVLVTLDVAPVDSNTTGDWYLEFEFEPPETDEVLRIEAWLVTSMEGPKESSLPSEPVSVWEITPADRAVGLGGYARLYLSRELHWKCELNSPLILRIVSEAVPGEVLKAGVESAAASPATSE